MIPPTPTASAASTRAPHPTTRTTPPRATQRGDRVCAVHACIPACVAHMLEGRCPSWWDQHLAQRQRLVGPQQSSTRSPRPTPPTNACLHATTLGPSLPRDTSQPACGRASRRKNTPRFHAAIPRRDARAPRDFDRPCIFFWPGFRRAHVHPVALLATQRRGPDGDARARDRTTPPHNG